MKRFSSLLIGASLQSLLYAYPACAEWEKIVKKDPFDDKKVTAILRSPSADRSGTFVYGCSNEGSGKIEERTFWSYSTTPPQKNVPLGLDLEISIRFDQEVVATEQWKWIAQSNILQPKDGGIAFIQKIKGKRKLALKESSFTDQVAVFDISGFDAAYTNIILECKK